MSVADRLRATADAIEADARERAGSLRAVADAIETDADAPVSLARAAADLGLNVRVLREAARRGELEILGPRSARVVRRTALEAWLTTKAPKVRAPAPATDAEGDRAALERTRLRLVGGDGNAR